MSRYVRVADHAEWGSGGRNRIMTYLLRTIYLLAFLSCCIIAVALTEVRGHAKLGPFTFAYNESPVQYVELAINASQLKP